MTVRFIDFDLTACSEHGLDMFSKYLLLLSYHIWMVIGHSVMKDHHIMVFKIETVVSLC